MTEEPLPQIKNAGRALMVLQSALNLLINDGTISKQDLVDGINETFNPSFGGKALVIVEHPSETHAILTDFVSGLTDEPRATFQSTMEV